MIKKPIVIILALIFAASGTALGQTSAFTFQGKLTDTSLPANGPYDLVFRLFDSAEAGTQIGPDITIEDVNVSGGLFTVILDFGQAAFSIGDPRFIQVSVRQGASTEALTELTPRQEITSSPFAIKSRMADEADTAASAANADNAVNAANAANAAQLGGIAADQYVVTTDPRMSDERPPAPGSTNYIQNQSTSQQSSSSFSISGTGAANIFDSAQHYRIGGVRVFHINGSNNVSAGAGAGASLLNGRFNAFFGFDAGAANLSGRDNSFFGNEAGSQNTASNNSFFGSLAGRSNTSGTLNAFFGVQAGIENIGGSNNSYFGAGAGLSSTSSGNSFFGSSSGFSTSSGSENAFFGASSGFANTTGVQNTLIGTNSSVGSNNLQNSTAVGYRAQVSQSNSLVLGSINGVNEATADTNVGIGTTAPASRLHVNGAVFVTGPRTSTPSGNAMTLSSDATADTIQSFGNRPLSFNPAGNNVGIGETAPETRLHVSSGSNTQLMLEVTSGRKWVLGNMSGNNGNFEIRDHTGTQLSRFTINSDGNIGAGTQAPTDRLDVNGTLRVRTLGSAGSDSLCRNASGQISSCSSSLRYKENIFRFGRGLDLIRRLDPITFNWKGNGALDLGLGAEDVAAVDPLLVNYNEKGEVEGVKYDRIGVVLVNAVKEQQEQIASQTAEIDQLKQRLELQRREIAELRALVCSVTPNAGICSSPK